MTMDNTTGRVEVGEVVARVTGLVFNNNTSQTETQDVNVGLIMQVTPRIGSDGLITMEIDATRSEIDENDGTPIGTDENQVPIIVQNILTTTANSTVAAYSGQTVIFGGLIQKIRAQESRRVPFIADIPLIGNFFKYDLEVEERSELLVIMTPMLVTGEEDLDYVKSTESSRMSWCLADVVEMHGDVGLSGGYGLWGPAVGQTIYPDLQPTVQGRMPIEPLLERASATEQLPAQNPQAVNPGMIDSSYIAPSVVTPPNGTIPSGTRVNGNAPVMQSPTDELNLSQRGAFAPTASFQPAAARAQQGSFLPRSRVANYPYQSTANPQYQGQTQRQVQMQGQGQTQGQGQMQGPATRPAFGPGGMQRPYTENAARIPQSMSPQIWANQPNTSSMVPQATVPQPVVPNAGNANGQQTGFAIPPASQATWLDQATGSSSARQTGFTPATTKSRVQPTRLGQQ
jgi:hypothetical protein